MTQSSQGFQSQVNVQPVPAYEGDFASTNPRFSVLAGPGALVAGSAGVTVGRFAWAASVFPGGAVGPGSFDGQDSNGFPAIVANTGTGPVTGFVHREQQGLITTFLAEAGNVVQSGYGITLMSGGDFWVKNNGTAPAVQGQKCYANFIDGKASFAATGNPNTGTLSGSIGPATSTFNGAIAGNVLTVSTLVSGTITVGGTVTGGTGIVTGTQIASQISGTTGGVGVYTVSIGDQNVSSALLTETYGVLTIGTATTGTVGVGDTITGGSVTAGTFVSSFITGSGGAASTASLNITQTVAAGSPITFALNVETKWIAMSTAQVGELLKISDHPLG